MFVLSFVRLMTDWSRHGASDQGPSGFAQVFLTPSSFYKLRATLHLSMLKPGGSATVAQFFGYSRALARGLCRDS
jgi:hypothetical protein